MSFRGERIEVRMINLQKKRMFQLLALVALVVLFIVINVFVNTRKKEIYGDYNGVTEYLPTIEVEEYLEKNEGKPITFSFDIRADQAGVVELCLYDEDAKMPRYYISERINVSTEFQHYEVTVVPSFVSSDRNSSYLVFHGGYGTGVIPHVKNVVISISN